MNVNDNKDGTFNFSIRVRLVVSRVIICPFLLRYVSKSVFQK